MQIKNHLIGTIKFRTTLSVILLLIEHGGTLSSSEMSQRMDVNAAYLRKILSTLLKSGMVEAKEGYDGGYRLRKPRNAISLADVYDAVREAKKGEPNHRCDWTRSLHLKLEKVIAEVDQRTISCLKEFKATDMLNS